MEGFGLAVFFGLENGSEIGELAPVFRRYGLQNY
jgi:hypothetical protein